MKRERTGLAILLAFFLLLNGATLSRYPSVWIDEVQFADPATNFASGHGFTSTAWFAQDSSQIWAGNAPLYSTLLAGWLKVLGPGLIQERSFNLVLFCIFVLLFRRWLKETGLVESGTWRLAAVAVLLCGHAMMFSYRSGRYDVLGMVLAMALVNLWCAAGCAAEGKEGSKWPLFLTSLLIPAAGLQLLPALLVFTVLLCVVLGREAVSRSALLVAGAAAGVAGLRVLYGFLGIWDGFRVSTSAVGTIGRSFGSKVRSIPAAFFHDKSALILVVLLVCLFAAGYRRLDERGGQLIAFSSLAFLLLPAGLQLAGKFPIYYGWMIFIPLTAAVFHLAGKTLRQDSPILRGVTVAALCAAGLVGLPLRLAAVSLAWANRDPLVLANFLQSSIAPGETVVADFKTYYALREMGTRPLLPTYLTAMRPEESAAVTALVLRQGDVAAARASLGGNWRTTGAVLTPLPSPAWLRSIMAEIREDDYSLSVYRRTSP